MKEFVLSSNTTARYTSMEELRKAYGLEPMTKRTSDLKKLQKQQDRFYDRHKCKACNRPLTYIGGNIMTCTNNKCKGIKYERNDDEGNIIISYRPYYELLDEKGADIANNILD